MAKEVYFSSKQMANHAKFILIACSGGGGGGRECSLKCSLRNEKSLIGVLVKYLSIDL